MSSKESQPMKENYYTVTVDDETGSVTVSLQLSREEFDSRIQEVDENDEDIAEEDTQMAASLFPIGKVWWCATCQSGLKESVKAYTEVDAGFRVCGLQSFNVTRHKCSV